MTDKPCVCADIDEILEPWIECQARTAEERARVRQGIESAIGGLSETHPVWIAIMGLLSAQWRMEHAALANPNLNAEQVRYQLGRERAVEDVRVAFASVLARTRKK